MITPIRINSEVTFLKMLTCKTLPTTKGKNARKAKKRPPRNDKRATVFSKYFEVDVGDPINKKRFFQTYKNNLSEKSKPEITPYNSATGYVKITFLPDFEKFSMKELDVNHRALIEKRTYDIAALSPPNVSVYLNNENVESEIRMKHVAESVSRIAEIKEVREKLVMEQRKLGKSGGIVMDGRDIGSVVFPNAELKFFITADIDVRTERRFSEMKEKGLSISKKEVESNLTQRDKIDSSRKERPLIKVKEAIEINNSNLSKEEQLELALKIVQETIDKLS